MGAGWRFFGTIRVKPKFGCRAMAGNPKPSETGRICHSGDECQTEGDIVAAVGGAAYPHMVLLRNSTGEAKSLEEIAGAVRYPAVSPDSARLAFSRRESGSWHLFVRDLSTGSEQRLTDGACNATSPAWDDRNRLLYATDCGRGFGLNAIARIMLNK